MNQFTETRKYRAFGYNIRSEIELHELITVHDDRPPDITIEISDLTELWSSLAAANESYVIKEDLVMFNVPGTAIYCVRDGSKITASPYPDCCGDELRLDLLGTCMGVIMLQRRVLPLHGSAVLVNGKAYAFVGSSGAGKSTLASTLLGKGCQLLSDDVIPVTIADGQLAYVTPAYPQQKLWKQSLDELGMEAGTYRPVLETFEKYVVPVSPSFTNEPVPLAAIFELVETEAEEMAVMQASRLERLFMLFHHTYRSFLIAPLGLMQWHFDLTSSLLDQVDLYQLRRPADRFTANELASLVLDTI